LAGTKKIDRKR